MKQLQNALRVGIPLILMLFLLLTSCDSGGKAIGDLNADQKIGSHVTDSINNTFIEYLNFDNETDDERSGRGYLGTYSQTKIMGDPKFGSDPNEPVYVLDAYDFIDGDAPRSANPSLWRQSKYNRKHGLFKVKEGSIYQIRGFDLANMTLIKCNENNEWLVIDPLGSPETAQAGMEVFKQYVTPDPDIIAVIFTHSHIDHFGGIEGLGDDDYEVIGPEGFFEEAVSENVMAGNCMGRRASYMYGNILNKDKHGTLGTGLGQTTSTGLAGISELDVTIGGDKVVKDDIGGLPVEYLYTPDSEAPAEMMFYFPTLQAFCQSEDLNHTLHNLYTLRGAKVRNGQKWSKYIDKAIVLWGDDAEISFGSHHWPTWDNDTIKPYWENQRDMYRFIHDQTLRLANNGYTPKELADSITLPYDLDTCFYNRGYYGSVRHNVKAQYQLYFGWFDGVPANLNPLPPDSAGKKYVDMFGTKEEYLAKAKTAFDAGEYRWAAEMLNHLVFGYPDYEDGRFLLADTYEQLGYQSESGPWRNFYLSGAQELRHEVAEGPTPATVTPDIVEGMENELLFDYLAMRFAGTNASAQEIDAIINVTLVENWPTYVDIGNESVSLIVSNGAVSPRIGIHTKNPNCEVVTTRDFFVKVLANKVNPEDLSQEELHIVQGEEIFKDFITEIEPMNFWFNISEP